MAKRRKLKNWERLFLYRRAKGKCQICDEPLKKGWHADHKTPFVKTGRTNIYDMQATCQACNLKKGAKEL